MNHAGFTTTVLHSDRQQADQYRAVHRPMHSSVAFAYDEPEDLIAVFQGRSAGFVYGRQGNPTTGALENKLTQMEQGKATACFSTGMAALAATFLSLLRTGDHVVASRYLFGNTSSLLASLQALGCEVSLVDATAAAHVANALRSNTRIVFVETIANPCTQVADLEGVGELCRKHGLLYVVDNTLTSPWLFRPAQVGASLVINSLTKYIGGHGNAMGGAVTDTGRYDWQQFPNIYATYRQVDPALWGITQIRKKGLRDMGATLQAEAAHRIAVGAETLALRLERTCSNAAQLARFLQVHPAVARVHYPGLEGHDQHQRAKQLFKAAGGLLALELHEDVDHLEVLRRLQVVICSSHLGDTRTLAIPVADTIYWEMGAAQRQSMGINDGLIRLSTGIEDIDDLLGDFEQALPR